MLFEKVEKRRIITFYFKTGTVGVGECIQPQQHWSKQHSRVVTPQERLLSIIQFFAKVFRRFILELSERNTITVAAASRRCEPWRS